MIKVTPILARASVAGIIWLLANSAVAGSGSLAEAAQRGDLASVKTLLASAEVQINEPARDGMTALVWATQANDLTIVQSLLEAGADANLGNRYGITPLWLAALNRSPAMVLLLLKFGADVESALPHGETALMAAARAGDAKSIDLLLAAGANPNASEAAQGETALMWAAADNHTDALRSLVKGGADPDMHSRLLTLAPMDWVQVGMVSTTLPVGGWTAAMYAARQDAREAIAVLAELGASLDEQDQDGTTALMIAIMNKHYDLAAEIIAAGANLNVVDRTGMSALYGAIGMVTHRRDIGRPSTPQFDTLKALDIVKLALANDADPNARLVGRTIGRHHDFPDFELGVGATALMRAAKSGDLESMRLLLEAGADPTLAMESGLTVLDLALGKGRSPANEKVQALLQEFVSVSL